MLEDKKEKAINPLWIVVITVICVMFFTFLIFYFDWRRDYY